MPKEHLIGGYDYISGQPLSCILRTWKKTQAAVLENGGHRRTMSGETLLSDKNGVLQYECYAIIPLPKQ